MQSYQNSVNLKPLPLPNHTHTKKTMSGVFSFPFSVVLKILVIINKKKTGIHCLVFFFKIHIICKILPLAHTLNILSSYAYYCVSELCFWVWGLSFILGGGVCFFFFGLLCKRHFPGTLVSEYASLFIHKAPKTPPCFYT